jgi:hypothetical protein
MVLISVWDLCTSMPPDAQLVVRKLSLTIITIKTWTFLVL